MTGRQPNTDSLREIRSSVLDRTYASLGNRRTDSVHEFYRYPARFAPDFAAAAIRAFTSPGDVVLDPFLGGGTTAVEGLLHGRHVYGSDLNELALFVSRAKVTLYSDESLERVHEWADSVPNAVRLNQASLVDPFWVDRGYLKNMNSSTTWRLRKAIAISLRTLDEIDDVDAATLARCSLLRTAQTALDARRDPSDVGTFRLALANNAHEMAEVARGFAEDVRSLKNQNAPVLLKQRLPGLSDNPIGPPRSPSLIVTSPPYPGVYVLYHRWKIGGRRESPAPYWIANAMDGHGQNHYTMAARADSERDRYFAQLEEAYMDLGDLSQEGTWLVQIVGFNDVPSQFDRYLGVMDRCGFDEVLIDELATEGDGRLWRDVPGRKWWVAAGTLRGIAPGTSREVVLVHRRRG